MAKVEGIVRILTLTETEYAEWREYIWQRLNEPLTPQRRRLLQTILAKLNVAEQEKLK